MTSGWENATGGWRLIEITVPLLVGILLLAFVSLVMFMCGSGPALILVTVLAKRWCLYKTEDALRSFTHLLLMGQGGGGDSVLKKNEKVTYILHSKVPLSH